MTIVLFVTQNITIGKMLNNDQELSIMILLVVSGAEYVILHSQLSINIHR